MDKSGEDMFSTWVWVKINPPGIGPQVLVHVATYLGLFWVPIFDPQPHRAGLRFSFSFTGWLHFLFCWFGSLRARLFHSSAGFQLLTLRKVERYVRTGAIFIFVFVCILQHDWKLQTFSETACHLGGCSMY